MNEMWPLILLLAGAASGFPAQDIENDGETSRKVLGSR